MPKFSVIIPVCHGGKFLTQALASLASVSSPSKGFEVIVAGEKQAVSDLSLFNCCQGEVRFVESKGNRSEILNAACAAARGNVWVFADDDCIFLPEWLINVERSLLEHPDALVLGGSDVLALGASNFDLALDVVLNSWIGTGGTRVNQRLRAGKYYPKLWNMTVMADAARRVTLDYPDCKLIFNPAFSTHEDVDLTQRITVSGGKVVYEPNVQVRHCRDTNFTSFFKRNICMAQICRRLGIHRGAHLALIALFTGLPAMGIASLTVPAIKTVFVFMAATYGIAIGLASVKGAVKKKRPVIAGLIPVLIVTLHVARASGYMFPFRMEADFKP